MVVRSLEIQNATISSRRRGALSSPAFLASILGITDVAAIVSAGLSLYFLYVDWQAANFVSYFLVVLIGAGVTVTSFSFAGLYRFEALNTPWFQSRRVVLIFGVICLGLVGLAFGLKISDQFSRVWTVAWCISSALMLCSARFLVYLGLHKLAKTGQFRRHIALVGAGEQGARLIERLKVADEPWDHIVGVFDERAQRIHPELAAYPMLGTITDLYRYCRTNHVDEVILALPWSADERILEIARKLGEFPVNVRISDDLVGLRLCGHDVSTLRGVRMLEVSKRPEAGWRYVFKAVEDRILGAILILLFSPIMLLIAAVIKLDSQGPVLFKQKRYGFNRALIEVYKFRTMFHEKVDQDGAVLTQRNDPRVTRVGRFLRRTSLDELPQLFNVTKGDMSLIGPRPHALQAKAAGSLYEEAVSEYAIRHKVKPGITGWAQVNGWRGDTDTIDQLRERVRHDIYYIENWSVALEFWILVKTAIAVVRGTNAH